MEGVPEQGSCQEGSSRQEGIVKDDEAFKGSTDKKALTKGGDVSPVKKAASRARKAVKKRPAKKSTAKKATAKKRPAKKSTAKKRTAKKSTAKKRPAKKRTAKKSTAKKRPARKSTAKKR